MRDARPFEASRQVSGSLELRRAPPGVQDRRSMQGTDWATASTITTAVAVLVGCLTKCKSAAGPQARSHTNQRFLCLASRRLAPGPPLRPAPACRLHLRVRLLLVVRLPAVHERSVQ